MNNQGWWLRVEDGKTWEIHDHACDFAATPVLSQAMGIPSVYNELKAKVLKPTPDNADRLQVLFMVMAAGFVRVRQHGISYTFEFTGNRTKALNAIRSFAGRFLGDLSGMQINHIAVGNKSATHTDVMNYRDFKQQLDKENCTPIAKT